MKTRSIGPEPFPRCKLRVPSELGAPARKEAANAAVMDAPVTLPTEDDYERARQACSAAVKALSDLRWRVWYLTSPEEEENRRGPGDQVPTREQIGLTYSAASTLLGYVNEAKEYAEELMQQVPELDLVRLEVTGERF